MSSGALAVNTPGLATAFSQALIAIGYFEPNPTIAVAVSGGPDSMALLLLLQEWATTQDGTVVALTVNHGLRSESAEEARWVAEQCAARGITHHTLKSEQEKPRSAIQEAARDERYQLLAAWCREHHVLHLFTAHHKDDQAETVLFRAARGSGLSGLAGISAVSVQSDVRLIRPLLSFPKSELMDYLAHKKQDWLEDPSNKNPAYSRTALRRALRGTNLTDRISQLSASLAKARNLLEYKEASYLAESVIIDPAGFAILPLDRFLDTPPVIAQSMLSSLLQTISGSTQAPRSATLQLLHDEMTRLPPLSRRNVAGCLLQYRAKERAFYLMREAAATAPSLPVEEGKEYRWDNRFTISYQADGKLPAITVGGLGEQAARLGKIPYPYHDLPATVLAAFPGFFLLEELLLAPHIHYRHPEYGFLAGSARFRPTKPLAGGLFSAMNIKQ